MLSLATSEPDHVMVHWSQDIQAMLKETLVGSNLYVRAFLGLGVKISIPEVTVTL